MSATHFAVKNRATTMAMVLVAVALGASTFLTMPRREDPEIVIRVAVVVTQWPGAPADKVEELVTDPLESAIAELDQVHSITSISKVGSSVITVELTETLPAASVDQAWDEVRAKVGAIQSQLPQGVSPPFVNSGFGDVYAVCIALYPRSVRASDADASSAAPHNYTDRELELLADDVKSELERIDSVAKVELHGVQREVIYLEVASSDWSKIGLTAEQLGQLLSARNIVAPAGEIDTGTTRVPIRPTGDFQAVQSIRDVVVGLRDEELPIFLRDLPVRVNRTSEQPARTRCRVLNANKGGAERFERALVLAVSMKSGGNVVTMGNEVRKTIASMRADTLPYDIELTVVNDLPRQVDTLIGDFVTNLWQAILIVLLVALLMLGWRPALIMATAVPLAMIASLFVVRQFGVELEQFSIASLIIALGMIVDNAIVVSDNTVRLLNEGATRKQAAIEGARSLAIPILTSTLTTVAAFLPMLTIEGSVGEYVRSLPIVVATTLLMSYFVAMTVTPIMCYWLLRAPKPDTSEENKSAIGSAYERSMRWCLSHKAVTLGIAALLVVLSLMLVPLIGNEFFPLGDRDQFFIHTWLPEGASLESTAAAVDAVEDAILETQALDRGDETIDRLVSAISFVGSGGPRLMLTSNPEQNYANYAYTVVNTSRPDLSAPWIEELQKRVETIPGAQIDVRRFVLGPAVKYPVEYRLINDDSDELRESAEALIQIFRETPGTLAPMSDWKNPSYQVEVDVDASRANLAGVTNIDVASTMSGLISGRQLTVYRDGDHQVPVILRLDPVERQRLARLRNVHVNGRLSKVPLTSIATLRSSWQPSVIARREQSRTLTVGCQVAPGFLANAVTESMRDRVEELVASMSPSTRYEVGGAAAEATESQAKLAGAFLLSAVLILLVLVTQYNSFAKPLIVLAAVPLSLVGAFLALFLTGWALGFMPMLGIISLAGVVINNAIILIDFIQQGCSDGMELRDAVAQAGRLRMKPIVLTTLTTIGGMLPLALFAGPLWAGMAWAVIGGLAVSTVLTLFVIPTLYAACAEHLGMRVIASPRESA